MKVRYFAWLRERTGTAEEAIELPDNVNTPAALMEWLKQRDEAYAYAFEETDAIRTAIDHEHVEHDHPLTGAREIAFFPPMTGG
ncbi:molybdopterin converting factor subunit 1 [Rhodobacteraceae bacterium RKSG542]|uniref:molybdopterin converting factor subunit 1 n=1 Tax=Pseudovibrio flavus TaxID=2529854 RepID=UPI003528EB10|nr:molybdopterin converting factor subunit 1 [Pseudovibrio flavus]